ncbi:MAG: hypothetical protein D6698_10120 [Gammaproteobacteria bacterium]|nr:MAG: hypothetical protein D6698_10120 [Gammaproteobacteria bacterium]
MAADPLSLLLVAGTTAFGAATNMAQAQAQNDLMRRTKATNKAIAKVNATRRREQIASEFARVSGALRVSAGERGAAQARSSQALALSSASEANRSMFNLSLEEFLQANRGLGIGSNVMAEGISGGLKGLNAGLSLNQSLTTLGGT